MYYELDWYKVTLAGIPCLVAPCGYVEYDTYKDELPDGLHLYHIRHSDDDFDYPSTIEKFVCVNHYGLLLTPTELEIPVKGYIDLGHDDTERIYDVITSSNPVSDPLSYMVAGSPAICWKCGRQIRHGDECASLNPGYYNAFETSEDTEGFNADLGSLWQDQRFHEKLLCGDCIIEVLE